VLFVTFVVNRIILTAERPKLSDLGPRGPRLQRDTPASSRQRMVVSQSTGSLNLSGPIRCFPKLETLRLCPVDRTAAVVVSLSNLDARQDHSQR